MFKEKQKKKKKKTSRKKAKEVYKKKIGILSLICGFILEESQKENEKKMKENNNKKRKPNPKVSMVEICLAEINDQSYVFQLSRKLFQIYFNYLRIYPEEKNCEMEIICMKIKA